MKRPNFLFYLFHFSLNYPMWTIKITMIIRELHGPNRFLDTKKERELDGQLKWCMSQQRVFTQLSDMDH